jgi:glycerophosphoryl diester phosphodiesterase
MGDAAWPYPRLLAHRGGGLLAPENTLAALAAGHARGYRAVEFDAVLTADEVPVLLHDATLERTTDGRGGVGERSLDALAGLDAGCWFDARFAGERLPTLEQALQRCRELALWPNVEIKPVPGREARTGALVAAAVARFCAAPAAPDAAPLLSSFAPEALAAARAVAPQLRRGLLFGRVPRNWQQGLQAVDAWSLHCDHRTLGADQARAVRAAGYGLMCYTVNEAERVLELAGWGVQAFCTDRIDRIDPGLLG